MFNRTEHEEKEKQNRTFLFVAATQHRDADFRWPRRRRFRWRLRDATTTLRSNIIYTRRVEGTDQTHSRGCVHKRKASKRRETRENRRFRHYIIRKSNNNILQSKTSLNLRTIHNKLKLNKKIGCYLFSELKSRFRHSRFTFLHELKFKKTNYIINSVL